MWQPPNRPNHIISQSYNDGIVTIYNVSDTATAGYAPQPTITATKYNLHYAEKRVGVTRYYAARQAQTRIDRVVRVQRVPNIQPQDVAKTEDGIYYRIDQIQSVEDVYPASLDLSLVLFEQNIEEVADDDTNMV